MSSPSLRCGFSTLRDAKPHCDLCNPHFLIIITLLVTGPGHQWCEQQLLYFIKHLTPRCFLHGGDKLFVFQGPIEYPRANTCTDPKEVVLLFLIVIFGWKQIAASQEKWEQFTFRMINTICILYFTWEHLPILQRYRISQYVSGFFLYQLWVRLLPFLHKKWRAWCLLTGDIKITLHSQRDPIIKQTIGCSVGAQVHTWTIRMKEHI